MDEEKQRIKTVIQEHTPTVIGSNQTIDTAVLLPLTGSPTGQSEIIFQKRSEDLDIQPGDVCFPGGFKDSNDESFQETAVRETCEELGLSRNSVTVFGQFDTLLVPWALTIVTYVGWVEEFDDIQPDTTEVESVFRVPLERVHRQEPEVHEVELRPCPDEDFPYEKIPGGKDYDWRPRQLPELFYEFNGYHVWGITARILTQFLETLESEEQDANGE